MKVNLFCTTFYTGCQFLAKNSDIGSRLSVRSAMLGSRSRNYKLRLRLLHIYQRFEESKKVLVLKSQKVHIFQGIVKIIWSRSWSRSRNSDFLAPWAGAERNIFGSTTLQKRDTIYNCSQSNTVRNGTARDKISE